MAETRWSGAPLLEAGQAQKHVTVNEALTLLDALAAGRACSRRLSAPPMDAAEGDVFVLPADASGDWAGRGGSLAIFENGVWAFASPVPGRRLWIVDESSEIVFDGQRWTALGFRASRGAATRFDVLTLDHAVAPGPTSTTVPIIPDKAIVFGVTARVLESLSGPELAGWSLGVPGASGRYGSGHGLLAGTSIEGVTGHPLAYYGETPLLLEATGGSFAAGVVRFAVHCVLTDPPAMP